MEPRATSDIEVPYYHPQVGLGERSAGHGNDDVSADGGLRWPCYDDRTRPARNCRCVCLCLLQNRRRALFSDRCRRRAISRETVPGPSWGGGLAASRPFQRDRPPRMTVADSAPVLVCATFAHGPVQSKLHHQHVHMRFRTGHARSRWLWSTKMLMASSGHPLTCHCPLRVVL